MSQANGELQAAHVPAKAKRVIQLFMNGGPFHGDLFDPKPQLLKFAGQRPAEADLRTERRTAGLMPSPCRFRPAGESGVPVSELLPLTVAMHRRHGNHSFDVYRQSQSRPCPAADEQRHDSADTAQHGIMAVVWTWAARMRICRHTSCCVPASRCGFRFSGRAHFLPGSHQGTYINHRDPVPDKLIPFLRNSDASRADQVGTGFADDAAQSAAPGTQRPGWTTGRPLAGDGDGVSHAVHRHRGV